MFLAITLGIVFSASSATAANENSKEYGLMCALTKLSTQEIPQVELLSSDGESKRSVTEEVNSAMVAIARLNLTVMSKKRLAVLEKLAPANPGSKIVAELPGKELFSGVSAETLNQILEVYRTQKKGGAQEEAFTKLFHRPADEATAEKISAIFAVLAAKATAVADTITKKEQKLQLLRQQARQALLTALYGGDWKTIKTTEDDNPTKAVAKPADSSKFPFATGGRDAHCKPGTAAANTAGDALAADLVCLCTGSNSDSTEGKKHCTTTEINGVTPIDSAQARTHAKATYIALYDACKFSTTAGSLTQLAQQLTSKKDALLGTMGTKVITTSNAPDDATDLKKTKNFLGMFVADGNTAAACATDADNAQTTAGKGVCVDYTRRLATDDGIKWSKAIDDAANKLNEAASIAGDVSRSVEQLHGIENQMQALLLMGDSLAPPVAAVSNGQQKEATVKQQNKCKAENKTADECPSDHCDYNKEKGCTAKPASETTAAGTGEGAADRNRRGSCRRANLKMYWTRYQREM
ncbi:Trypanosomal VSG domain containing protein, putative [Trypanosoma equiperdum]|uniref:Trypanosomal VSG domain containing protein, putative n=1 Tax=Trypanosoma equiperdum TaxID=5694 RepID=A0A1G4I0Q2_TRYEQ|nr:Trypanosomal VSG domain containing protein, putative [Trypanosoma equiperdum]